MTNRLLIIGGPTGIGKSSLAVKLALKYNGVIIGADSMQIYRGMNIGTGKITEEEKCGIQHSMIDIAQPDCEYSVQKYHSDASKHIQSALNNGKLPIVVGGTGLYINALINEQNFAKTAPDNAVREKYKQIAENSGTECLHDMLKEIDAQSAEKISPNDAKRIIRALEIFEQTGKKKSEIAQTRKSAYNIKFLILQSERQELYNKINARVETMFKSGLIDEVMALKNYWDCRSMQAIGYKEIISALKSNSNPLNTSEEIKQNTRRYAKRQITFFKWINSDKTYIENDFMRNSESVIDNWLNEG